MKYVENGTACFHCSDIKVEEGLIAELSDLLESNSYLLQPDIDTGEALAHLLSQEGFQLYSTVRKTTLVYDPATDCYLKILHPLSVKNRVSFLLVDRARAIHRTSQRLNSEGVRTMSVIAYGYFKSRRHPFFVVRRAGGESLYNLLIRGKRKLPLEVYLNVASEIAKIHHLGYWLGDAHLSHIFITDGRVSGIIDIDSIRKNRFSLLKNHAKDIAGLNHPELPLTRNEKSEILHYYLNAAGIRKEKRFLQLLQYYTERRWKV